MSEARIHILMSQTNFWSKIMFAQALFNFSPTTIPTFLIRYQQIKHIGIAPLLWCVHGSKDRWHVKNYLWVRVLMSSGEHIRKSNNLVNQIIHMIAHKHFASRKVTRLQKRLYLELQNTSADFYLETVHHSASCLNASSDRIYLIFTRKQTTFLLCICMLPQT